MSRSMITCVVNGNAYRFDTINDEEIKRVLPADKQQLLELLESINKYEVKLQKQAVKTNAKTKMFTQQHELKPERMSSQDIDALMNKLILEDQENKKSAGDKGKRYKYLGMLIVGLVLLMILF